MQTEIDEFVHVACPKCFTGNRVPENRLGDQPKCGKCSSALLDGAPVALGEDSFDAFTGRTGLPVVVDFWAPWCGPCRAMAPAFEKVSAELKTRARFAKVNTEDAQGLASRMGIRAIPTLVLFKDGREIDRASGAMDARSLSRWVERHV